MWRVALRLVRADAFFASAPPPDRRRRKSGARIDAVTFMFLWEDRERQPAGQDEAENRVFWVSLEGEFGGHAEVFAAAVSVDTVQLDNVVTIRGIRWNRPLELVVHWVT